MKSYIEEELNEAISRAITLTLNRGVMELACEEADILRQLDELVGSCLRARQDLETDGR